MFAVLGAKGLLKQFDSIVNGQVIQFGGNASVGNGLTKVTRIGGEA